MKASQKGHYRVVEELLLKCGADIDLQNSNGMSALMLAVREEQSKIVEFLVAKGAKVDLQTVGGDTALSQAVLRNSVKAAEILLDNNASTDNVGTDSLLHQAVGLMDTKMVELLLKKGVPVDRRSQSSRQTALMIACQLCNVELTELLLEYGADVKLFDKSGEYALLHAVRRAVGQIRLRLPNVNPPKVIELLLEKGADATIVPNKGESAKAMLIGSVQLIKVCINFWAGLEDKHMF